MSLNRKYSPADPSRVWTWSSSLCCLAQARALLTASLDFAAAILTLSPSLGDGLTGQWRLASSKEKVHPKASEILGQSLARASLSPS